MIKRGIFLLKIRKYFKISWLLQKALQLINKLLLKITKGLAGNRAAITQGLNQLGQLINQPQEEPPPPQEGEQQGQPPPYEEVIRQQQNELYDLERNFTQEYYDVLHEYAFPRPRDFFRTDVDRLAQHIIDARGEILALTRSINGRSNRQNPTPDYVKETQNLGKKERDFKKIRRYNIYFSSEADFKSWQRYPPH